MVFAIGDWKGEFGTDEQGRGGLAALHTLVSRTRARLAVERGRVLLLHGGDFSGARDRDAFHRKLLPPGLNLPRYLNFDALALSPRENQFLVDQSFLPDFRFTRAVEFSQGLPAALGPAVGRYRIAPGEDYNVFLSGWTGRPPLRERSALLKSMRAELDRQTGIDLSVLLANDDLDPDQRDVADTLLGLDPEQNPYDLIDPEERRHFLWIRSSAARNRFMQLESGTHYCALQGRTVCRVEYLFRDHRLIGLEQRFIDLNARDRSGAWIPPDRRLVEILRREGERKAPPARNPRGEIKIDRENATGRDAGTALESAIDA